MNWYDRMVSSDGRFARRAPQPPGIASLLEASLVDPKQVWGRSLLMQSASAATKQRLVDISLPYPVICSIDLAITRQADTQTGSFAFLVRAGAEGGLDEFTRTLSFASTSQPNFARDTIVVVAQKLSVDVSWSSLAGVGKGNFQAFGAAAPFNSDSPQQGGIQASPLATPILKTLTVANPGAGVNAVFAVADQNRRAISVFNNSTAPLSLYSNPASSPLCIIPPAGLWEPPSGIAPVQQWNGIWSAAGGNAYITTYAVS